MLLLSVSLNEQSYFIDFLYYLNHAKIIVQHLAWNIYFDLSTYNLN